MFDLLGNLIKDIFGGILDTANHIVGLATQTPSQLFGKTYWNSLLKIGTQAVMPFAILLLGYCMAADLYRTWCRSNGELDMEFLCVTFVKYIIPFLCISYTYDILQFIFNMINTMVKQLYIHVSLGTGSSIDTNAFLQQASGMDFWHKFGLMFQLIVPWLCTQFMNVVSTVVIYGRLFEMTIYWIFAPIPFATFANDELRGSIGVNFIKMFCALVLQVGLIVLTVSLYVMLVKSVTIQTSVGGAFAMVGYSAVLTVTLIKSGSLSKRLLGTY